MDQIGKDVGQKLQKLEGEGCALIRCFELKGRVSEFVDPLTLSHVHNFWDSPTHPLKVGGRGLKWC